MEDEKRINKVLAYQALLLDEIETPGTNRIEDRIARARGFSTSSEMRFRPM